MKDLEKADAMHSEKHKNKEESKQNDGNKGLEKGNNKNGKFKTQQRRQ